MYIFHITQRCKASKTNPLCQYFANVLRCIHWVCICVYIHNTQQAHHYSILMWKETTTYRLYNTCRFFFFCLSQYIFKYFVFVVCIDTYIYYVVWYTFQLDEFEGIYRKKNKRNILYHAPFYIGLALLSLGVLFCMCTQTTQCCCFHSCFIVCLLFSSFFFSIFFRFWFRFVS